MNNRQKVKLALTGRALPCTASDLASRTGIPLNTVSSLLTKMARDGEVSVHPDFGPMGGNGYTLKGDLVGQEA